MSSLIDRLENAREGSRDISHEIARALGWEHRENVKNDFKWLSPDGQAYLVPPDFSRSIDAALTALPEGWFGEVSFDKHRQTAWIREANEVPCIYATASTSALALITAILKSRLTTEKEG